MSLDSFLDSLSWLAVGYLLLANFRKRRKIRDYEKLIIWVGFGDDTTYFLPPVNFLRQHCLREGYNGKLLEEDFAEVGLRVIGDGSPPTQRFEIGCTMSGRSSPDPVP